MTDSLSQLTPLLIVGAVIVGVMLVKKLVKIAILIAVVVFVVVPWLNANGALDSVKSALGL